ncbi:MAG TPA: sarcosine oxidase subunit gamma family protein [Rhizobiaceae bacterium]|nr:sarcosine oxidase subunit gamma family protein [Rhizobiaceae bacterium]
MVEPVSPLLPVWHPGVHGNPAKTQVVLTETRPGSIAEVTAWPGAENEVRSLIAKVTGLDLPDQPGGGAANATKAAFGFAPRRFLVVDQAAGMDDELVKAISEEHGTVTPLSHGRTAIRLSGPKSEWVLAKLFAIDFSRQAFPIGSARATAHHDIFAQIHRTGEDQFDLYVFRSFARSFWTTLCHAAAEVGYEVK